MSTRFSRFIPEFFKFIFSRTRIRLKLTNLTELPLYCWLWIRYIKEPIIAFSQFHRHVSNIMPKSRIIIIIYEHIVFERTRLSIIQLLLIETQMCILLCGSSCSSTIVVYTTEGNRRLVFEFTGIYSKFRPWVNIQYVWSVVSPMRMFWLWLNTLR